jgi:hypothetical protein
LINTSINGDRRSPRAWHRNNIEVDYAGRRELCHRYSSGVRGGRFISSRRQGDEPTASPHRLDFASRSVPRAPLY